MARNTVILDGNEAAANVAKHSCNGRTFLASQPTLRLDAETQSRVEESATMIDVMSS